jgi:mannose-6-phosphate isomerase-like protein (cupin superfamily)
MSNLSRPALAPAPEEQPLPLKSAPGAYRVGNRDDRPWGHYVVIDAGIAANGEEYCKKNITIEPLQILSLQSHKLRDEVWAVKKGTLTALKDGRRIEVFPGESIDIPAGSIHCMANMDADDDCFVEETQRGICRDHDIHRYMDVYRRDTETLSSPAGPESFTGYREILIDINKIRVNRKHGVAY